MVCPMVVMTTCCLGVVLLKTSSTQNILTVRMHRLIFFQYSRNVKYELVHNFCMVSWVTFYCMYVLYVLKFVTGLRSFISQPQDGNKDLIFLIGGGKKAVLMQWRALHYCILSQGGSFYQQLESSSINFHLFKMQFTTLCSLWFVFPHMTF